MFRGAESFVLVELIIHTQQINELKLKLKRPDSMQKRKSFKEEFCTIKKEGQRIVCRVYLESLQPVVAILYQVL